MAAALHLIDAFESAHLDNVYDSDDSGSASGADNGVDDENGFNVEKIPTSLVWHLEYLSFLLMRTMWRYIETKEVRDCTRIKAT